MIKALQVSGIILLVLFLSPPIFAHPGNTAADGCHYCRTNCDKWGVPWNERHCHGGSSIQEQPPTYIPPVEPTNTLAPLPTWTPKPPTATIESTNLPASTPEPTVAEVLGAESGPSPTLAVAGISENSSIGGIITMLILGGGYWLWKRRTTKNTNGQQK